MIVVDPLGASGSSLAVILPVPRALLGQDSPVPEDDPVNQAADPSAVPPAASLPSLPASRVPEPQDRSVRSDPDDGPRLGTDAIDARSSDVQQRTAPRLIRRLIILLGLLLIGLVTGIWAIALFPSRPQVVTSASFLMGLDNEANLNEIFLIITPEGQSTEDIELSASASVGSSALPPSRTGGLVTLFFPEKVVIKKCPTSAICQNEPAKSLAEIGMRATLHKNSTGGYTTGDYSFVVSNAHFGFSSNGEFATAALPTVLGQGPATADQILFVSYRAHDAAAYNWSVPPFALTAGRVGWSEPLTVSPSSALTAVAQPSEITGINYAAEARDNRDTFISGILLGVAGAAAIAAAQEGLHLLFDDRDDGTPRKLRRIGAQSG